MIGIVTFFSANNYGAVLQAYALQKAVEEYIGPCEQIDYHSKFLDDHYAIRKYDKHVGLKRNFINFARNVLTIIWRKKFNDFRAIIPRSKPYYLNNIRLANDKYDAFIAGSDMILDLRMTLHDTSYFLDFVAPNKYKATYAASIGEYLLQENVTYNRLLSRLDRVSLREKSMAAKLKEQINLEATVVPDPTLLLTKEQWDGLLCDLKPRKTKPYLLIYVISQNIDDVCLLSKKIAQKKGLETRIIHLYQPSSGIKKSIDKNLMDVSPLEFIDLIKNADYVVTSSYHALIFSLIFQRQFTVFLPKLSSERITDLLNNVGLSNRTTSNSDYFNDDVISYSNVIPKIECIREEGLAFLQEIKNQIENGNIDNE